MDEETNNQVRLVTTSRLGNVNHTSISSKLNWIRADTRRNKVNCYVIALPVISGTKNQN